jgi:hypothetical protein
MRTPPQCAGVRMPGRPFAARSRCDASRRRPAGTPDPREGGAAAVRVPGGERTAGRRPFPSALDFCNYWYVQ